ALGPQRRPRSRGHEVRLRRGAVWRVYGAREGCSNALVRDASRGGEGRRRHDDRGSVGRRHAPAATRVGGGGRPAMWVLPGGATDVGGSATEENAEPDRRRHRCCNEWEYLPLRTVSA